MAVWVSKEALGLWSTPRRTTRGGQAHYSDLAIELCLTLGLIFKQPLRQTQGLMRSIAKLLRVNISVPDFSTMSCRGRDLVLHPRIKSNSGKAIHLAVDSPGLKIFGEGEWYVEKHKNKAERKSWRILHLGLDLVSGEIICSKLTAHDVGDPTALPDLLNQIDEPVDLFLAGGAYDGSTTRDLISECFGASLEVVIPPPKNAKFSPHMEQDPTARDYQIANIKANGRISWQKTSLYNQRSRIETQMGRWKAVIGPKLKARRFHKPKNRSQYWRQGA